MIRVVGIVKRFGEELVLDRVSIEVGNGEIVGLVGPNGCGKTTLLRILSGLETPEGGTVEINGKIGYVPQDDILLPWLSLKNNIALGLRFRGVSHRGREDKVYEAATFLGITEYLNKYPRHVSGGTARKASIARALVLEPDILLLDEPYSGLDISSIDSLQSILTRVSKVRGVSMLIVSHQIDELAQIANKIYSLSHKPSRVKSCLYRPFDIDLRRSS